MAFNLFRVNFLATVIFGGGLTALEIGVPAAQPSVHPFLLVSLGFNALISGGLSLLAIRYLLIQRGRAVLVNPQGLEIDRDTFLRELNWVAATFVVSIGLCAALWMNH